jgi:DNA-binding response OmpR family regulator
MAAQILLVEDSPTQALRLRLIMEREGLIVNVAQSGRAGIKIAHHRVPDAVILDINLPDINGFDVCRTLKAHPITAGTPVIMLTVKDRLDDTLCGLDAGADAYIPKDDYAEVNLLQVLRDMSLLKGQ